MNKKLAFILSTLVLFLLIGCSDDVSLDRTLQPPKFDKMGSENTLRIVIRWPGDDFASRQDLELREKIADLIVEKKVGKIVRVGTGMGWMDIFVEVKDKKIARSAIKEIIRGVAPSIPFTIE